MSASAGRATISAIAVAIASGSTSTPMIRRVLYYTLFAVFEGRNPPSLCAAVERGAVDR